MKTVSVEVVRPLFYRGNRAEAGARLEVPPADAFDLVSTPRARLVKPDDAAGIYQAVREVNERTTRGQRGLPPHETHFAPLR